MKQNNSNHPFEIIISTLPGLEQVLENEVKSIGGADIEVANRAVSCKGDTGFIYKANLALRTALRVYKIIHRFRFNSKEDYYNGIKSIDWTELFTLEQVFTIHSTINDSIFNNSMFVSQLAKDAIVDQFRDKFQKRPFLHNIRADFFINVHVFKDLCTVSLNSSGDSLHLRGYKKTAFKAPLNEVLAAGIIKLSNWHPSQAFYDPMCGSGTFSIEAALIAKNIPPGLLREKFAFMLWNDFDETLFDTIVESLASRISDEKVKIYTSDASRFAVEAATENIKSAELEDDLVVEKVRFENLTQKSDNGFVFLNPPYGERLELESIEATYGSIGKTLKFNWQGFQAWILTSSPEGMNAIGLRPSRKIPLFNGAIECRLLQYNLYSGSKKAKKNQDSID